MIESGGLTRSIGLALLLSFGSATSHAISLDSLKFWKSDEKETIQPIDQPHYVEDFAYGEFLYDYYQNRFFSSITQLLVAQKRDQFQRQPEHAELLLGSLFVAYGLLNEAEDIFLRLIEAGVKEETKNDAWFHIATLKYKQGDLDGSEEILNTKLTNPNKKLKLEREIILGLILMQRDQYEEAITKLNNIPKRSRVNTYAKYNLGVAFAGLGHGLKSTDLFDDVLSMTLKRQRNKSELSKSDLAEVMALKDRSALALGINFLHLERYEEAERAFNEIRLDGPFTNPALLGLGWARYHSEAGKESALTPWFELRSRSPADPAVQEVYLHIPYLYEQMGALQDALDSYQKASKLYKIQEIALIKAKERILQDDWIDQLSPTPDFKNDPLDLIPDFYPPKAFETFYLYQFFASNKFNEGYRNYRELQRLRQLILHWVSVMPVYKDMIDVNREHLANLTPQSQAKIDQAAEQQAYSLQRLTVLNSEIEAAIASNDLTKTATPEELALLERITKAQARVGKYEGTEHFESEAQKIDFYEGLWMWDQTQVLSERRWKVDKAKQGLKREIDHLNGTIQVVTSAQTLAEQRYDGFEERFQALGERLVNLLERLDTALANHQGYLQEIGVAIMDSNLEHIGGLKAEALLSVARLRDISFVMERRRNGLIPDYDETSDAIADEEAKKKKQKPWFKFWGD